MFYNFMSLVWFIFFIITTVNGDADNARFGLIMTTVFGCSASIIEEVQKKK